MLGTIWLLTAVVASVVRMDQIPLGMKIARPRPNIVFILTDDQDLHMASLDYMPLVKKHITDRGTFYKRHYCTTAICCPSRVTLWTGKNAHNTNVTDVNPPYGGYPKFVSQGLNDNYLPIWLQNEGYNTFYTGKLFNGHNVVNYDSPFPAGWTASDFLLDPYTYEYLNAVFQRNQDTPISYQGQYSTDVLAEKAYGLIDEAVALKDPFFLTIATNAPHSNLNRKNVSPKKLMDAPISAKRHEHLFQNVTIPRTANFNPEKHGGVSWIKDLPLLDEETIEYNDHFYRQRLRALQAVDEIVEGVVNRLESYGILDNTYLVYSTDNGYHISQHRLYPGKECGFEEDINIPLIIRGPGVPEGKTSSIVTAHTDLAPTFLGIAGGIHRADFDGIAIPLTEEDLGNPRQEHVNVEFWGIGVPEGAYGVSLDDDGKLLSAYPNNTYKALRLHGEDYNLYYSVWCNNERELYDMTVDPYQTTNLFPSILQSPPTTSQSLEKPWSAIIKRLDALLMVTKSCKGSTCVRPWEVIHPSGDVSTLKDALNPKFNAFYEAQAQRIVKFDKCEMGYIVESEGPQKGLIFGVGEMEERLDLK